MRTPPRRRMILRDWRKHEFGRNSASPPILRRNEEAANIKQENPNRAKVANGSIWSGFFPSSSHLTIRLRNQPYEGAAFKLGIPRQTLESKIRKLGINRHRFKAS